MATSFPRNPFDGKITNKTTYIQYQPLHSQINDLPDIEGVLIISPKVTDAGFRYLCTIHELKSLSISKAPITDAALVSLVELQHLELLEVAESRYITDTGIGNIDKLPNLKYLSLLLTEVTNAGLEGLAPLSRLELLYLPPKITDDGLRHLKAFPNLHDLRLEGTRITDEGLSRLSSLTELKKLDLSDTQISDAGLKSLAPLTQLRELYLTKTKVTQAGVREFIKSHPMCAVAR